MSSEEDVSVYESLVIPRYASLFSGPLLDSIDVSGRQQVLDVACGTGALAPVLLSELGEGSRLIGIDPDPMLLDRARTQTLEGLGQRIFFKTESAEKLSFSDGVFDLAVGNLALPAFDRPQSALSEILRVLRPGGLLRLTQAMSGTFEEVLDMFREVALKRSATEMSRRIEQVASGYLNPTDLEVMVKVAGFEQVEISCKEYGLPFGSAAELFSDPMIGLLAMRKWHWIAVADPEPDQVMSAVQNTLDTYFGRGPLSLSVKAGLIKAQA